MIHKEPTPDPRLLARYRVRIAIFLTAVLVCLASIDAVYKGFNTIAQLNLLEAERDRWQRQSDVISALRTQENSVVADVGCGSGYFALRISPVVGRSGQVLAVDLRKLSLFFLWIRALSTRKRNIHILLGDPDDPHLPRGTITAVLIANTYHEFAHPP